MSGTGLTPKMVQIFWLAVTSSILVGIKKKDVVLQGNTRSFDLDSFYNQCTCGAEMKIPTKNVSLVSGCIFVAK